MPVPSLSVRVEEALRTPTLVSVDGRVYPLRSAQLRARAEAGLASSQLVQTFANPHDEALEVIYTLPLPADGAVLAYTIRLGERMIRGEVQPREKAEAAYREALFAGRTAGLLEEDRTDTFQQRLGNLPPRTEVTVEIDVLQPLAFLGGTPGASPVWEYRFPTVVGPRYQGAPGRVTDAERLDVDRDEGGDIPSRLALELTVADALPGPDSLVSPSHRLDRLLQGDAVLIRLAEGARLDRDLVVQWPASSGVVGVRALEGRGNSSDAGRYALLTVTPPRAPDAVQRRDLTLLIDASGSMEGAPLETAKRVVSDLLEGLAPADRFEVIAFASAPQRLTAGLEEATPKSLKRCLQAITSLRAGGSTEMGTALREALSPLRADAQHQVVLVSDGYIGFEKELLAQLAHSLPAGVRLHTVGIGAAPNRALTQSLARGGRGVELLAGDEASAIEAARRLRAATDRPVLTEVSVSGTALCALAPARPRDVLAGQPLLLAAELHDQGGTLEVRGSVAGSSTGWRWQLTVPARAASAMADSPVALRATSLPLGALFGREAISDAEFELAAGGDAGALDARIEALGMRHQLASRRTSLVAIAEEPSVDPRAPRRRKRLPVELPRGVSAEGAGLVPRGTLTLGRPVMPRGAARASGVSEDAFRMARGQMRGGAPKSPTFRFGAPAALRPLVQATVVALMGPELVLEFEVPTDGFWLPSAEVEVEVPSLWNLLGSSRRLTARVVGEKSSPPGPHAAGLIVRLALRLGEVSAWPQGTLLALSWSGGRLGVHLRPETEPGAQGP